MFADVEAEAQRIARLWRDALADTGHDLAWIVDVTEARDGEQDGDGGRDGDLAGDLVGDLAGDLDAVRAVRDAS